MDMTHLMQPQHRVLVDQIKAASDRLKALSEEIHKVIVGQDEAITTMLIVLLCKGHILLEGLPGVAKTTMIKTLTQALGLDFKRIQFTPDLLPSDLIGTLIFNPKTHEFETKKGPIFAHLILADEINRAPAKVQSALLEAMQEQQVTIGSQTFILEKPFIVCATQNPIEQEGTYRLPEAQLDRFMMRVKVHYPSMHQEKQIIALNRDNLSISMILKREELLEMQELVSKVYIDERIIDYIICLIDKTRTGELAPLLRYGASPRATLALFEASRAHAFLRGCYFVTPDDVKSVLSSVLQHRLQLDYQAEAQGLMVENIIHKIIRAVALP